MFELRRPRGDYEFSQSPLENHCRSGVAEDGANQFAILAHSVTIDPACDGRTNPENLALASWTHDRWLALNQRLQLLGEAA